MTVSRELFHALPRPALTARQAPCQALCQGGYSLVEVMVVLAVTLVLALAVAPLSASWGSSAAVRQADASMQQAMSTLKSFALMNQGRVTDGSATAVMVVNATKVCVYRRIPTAFDCASADWQQALPVTLTLGGTVITGTVKACVALDNTAQRQAGPLAGWTGPCTTNFAYTLQKSGESKSGTLS
jgi:prepilin-type N-terminal cleavage/methylation domain-containing protein